MMTIFARYSQYYNYLNSFHNIGAQYRSGILNESKGPSALNNSYLYHSAGSRSLISQKTQSYLFNLKTDSAGLKEALSSLTGGFAFSALAVVSSNPDVLSARAGSAVDLKSISPMGIKVEQLASGQVNQGRALISGALAGRDSYHEFQLTVNGVSHNFGVHVSAGDSNLDIQKKMAQAVGNRDIGVAASVTTDKAAGTSSLIFQSKGLGDENRFTVRDVLGSLVEKTGTDQVWREPRDAIYIIDGGPARTARSNTIDLGQSLSVFLKKESDEEVTLAVGMDRASAGEAAERMVTGFNALLEAAQSAPADKGAQRLQSQLSGITRGYSASLSRIGIAVDEKGFMKIHREGLSQATDNGQLQAFFTQSKGANYGFANRLAQLNDSIHQNPASYVSKSHLGYSNLTNDSFYAWGNMLLHNRLADMGLLFDFWL